MYGDEVGQQKICTALPYGLHVTLWFWHYTTVSRVWVNPWVRMGVACTGTGVGFPDPCQHHHELPVTRGFGHPFPLPTLHCPKPGISSVPKHAPSPALHAVKPVLSRAHSLEPAVKHAPSWPTRAHTLSSTPKPRVVHGFE